MQELFKVLDSYEPDWNKEKELGSWAAEFLLDILEEEEWEEMTPEERTDRFNELLDERYEDFRSSYVSQIGLVRLGTNGYKKSP